MACCICLIERSECANINAVRIIGIHRVRRHSASRSYHPANRTRLLGSCPRPSKADRSAETRISTSTSAGHHRGWPLPLPCFQSRSLPHQPAKASDIPPPPSPIAPLLVTTPTPKKARSCLRRTSPQRTCAHSDGCLRFPSSPVFSMFV